jgi:hypothetical protein
MAPIELQRKRLSSQCGLRRDADVVFRLTSSAHLPVGRAIARAFCPLLPERIGPTPLHSVHLFPNTKRLSMR